MLGPLNIKSLYRVTVIGISPITSAVPRLSHFATAPLLIRLPQTM
jgi:hypothetical protein